MAREGGRERARDADGSEQVGLELGADVLEWRVEHRRPERDAGVVDDDRHIGGGPGRRGDRVVVGDIEHERDDPTVGLRLR